MDAQTGDTGEIQVAGVLSHDEVRVPGEGGAPRVLERSDHCVSRRNIDPDALRILYRLKECGFKGYLVGGCVRDLLLGLLPKDFDIATDAQPNQVKRLFRNCFLIGRRFRLAHVKFGQKVIEVATFRKRPEGLGEDELCKRDNTFGTPEEDAWRRDFTVNALFYDIDGFRVIDHVGGLDDIQARVIRSIGDAASRFREDPVRMLRAIRFASRLEGFTIEADAYTAITAGRTDILKCSPARLLEDMYKLFTFSAGARAVRLLRDTGMIDDLFPDLAECCRDPEFDEIFPPALERLDQKFPTATPPEFILAVLLYGPFVVAVHEREAAEEDVRYTDVAQALMARLLTRFPIPRRIQSRVVAMLAQQRVFLDEDFAHRNRHARVWHESRELRRIWLGEDEPHAAHVQTHAAEEDAAGEDPPPSAHRRRRRPRRPRNRREGVPHHDARMGFPASTSIHRDPGR